MSKNIPSSSSSAPILSTQQPKPNTSSNMATGTTTTTTTVVTKTAGNTQVLETVDFRVFENIEYPFCADYSKYEKILKIGQGTFG